MENPCKQENMGGSWLSGILTLIFFGLFVLTTVQVIRIAPIGYGWLAWLSAVPFLAFLAIMLAVRWGRLSKKYADSLAMTLLVPFALLFGFLFGFLYLKVLPEGVRDAQKYEEVRTASGFEGNMIEVFPTSIPDTAQDVTFIFHTALGQGGKVMHLQFSESEVYLRYYSERLALRSLWQGSYKDAELARYGVLALPSEFSVDIAGQPPTDTVVYVLYSKPYQKDNWNHGEVSYAAISRNAATILFYAEMW